ncbi:hypothetical protein PG995_002386 [Apiospora arundinis]
MFDYPPGDDRAIYRILPSLREGNALDLDIGAQGQLLHGHAATGGLVDHPLCVLLVHGGKVGHVADEDVNLNDLLQGRASGGQNSLQVLEAEGRLLAHGSLEHFTRGIQVDLAGAVDGRGSLDGVGLHREGPEAVTWVISAIVRLGVSDGRKMVAFLEIWKREEERLRDGDKMDRTGVARRLSDIVLEVEKEESGVFFIEFTRWLESEGGGGMVAKLRISDVCSWG